MAAANVLANDDLLKLILENRGLYASRHARVSKQWKRAAEAAKRSGQTLEIEPYLSCGTHRWARIGGHGRDVNDDGADMGTWASSISALPDNNLLVADTKVT